MSIRLRQFRSALLNLAFPPACVFCLDHLPTYHGSPFCAECLEALAGEPWEGCPRCAGLLIAGRCPHCPRRRYAFDAGLALGGYQGAWKEAVLRSKQSRFESLTWGLGQLLGRQLVPRLPTAADLVTAVPMHWTRRWSRGVHGARLLTEALSRTAGVPCRPLLRCRRRTRKQGTLAPQHRFLNVRGVFRAAAGYDLKGARVLLIDDVMTTGATLSEAARILKRAGAATVSVLVVARGTGGGQSPPPGSSGGSPRHGAPGANPPE